MSSRKRIRASAIVPPSKDVYSFMLKFSKKILDDPDIVKMGFCFHTYEYDYALMVIDEDVTKIYKLYACDRYCTHHFGKPFASGSLIDIAAYLQNKDNADVVMMAAHKNNRKEKMS